MLLSESISNIEVLSENTESGKTLYLEGIMMQSEKKNKNGRIYPKSVMEQAVDKYVRDFVSTKRALGEINHPDRVDVKLEEAAILIESLHWQGNDVVGKAKVLNTPKGNILRGLLEGGYRAGVSSRGTGSVVNESGTLIVQKDFTLSAIDFVDNPSAHDALPNAIFESEKARTKYLNELLELIRSYKI
jgi:hypothetical protein